MISLAKSFQANLHRFRERAEISQSQLGARAGYTTGYVSMLERGLRMPTLETIERLGQAMGIQDARLFFRKGKS